MHILVFEPALDGHHLVFLRHVLSDFLSAGHAVTLAADHTVAPPPALRLALGPLSDACRWHALDRGAGQWLHGEHLDALARAQTRVRADLVFASCFDLFTSDLFRRTAFGLPAPRALRGRLSGIFIRPRVADARVPPRPEDRWKRRGFLRLMRQGWFRHIFVLDETLPAALVPGVDPRRVSVLPDPWEGDFSADRAMARRALNLPAGDFLFLHYGTSRPRKGLPIVLRATAALPAGARAALVCAGRAGENHQAALRSLAKTGRAHVFNRFIPDTEEPLFFRACDAVVLAYEGHYGSSGILARAAAAGRMVIASDEGLVGTRTRTHGLGLTFATGDAGALVATLRAAQSIPAGTFAPALAAYARQHSREAFRTALLGAVNEGTSSIPDFSAGFTKGRITV